MIRKITFQRYKSLRKASLEPGPVTILIGPNASGKSNVLDALRLLSESVSQDAETAVSRRGGIESAVFRGSEHRSFVLELDYFVPDPRAPHSRADMRYRVEIGDHKGQPAVLEEELRIKREREEPGAPKIWLSGKLGKGWAIRDPDKPDDKEKFDSRDPGVLALKALGFLSAYPRVMALRTFIESWQFLSVNLGKVREPKRDERATRLDADASNLANVLRTLRGSETYNAILSDLAEMLQVIEKVDTEVSSGLVFLIVKERFFDAPWGATAVSDGTLRLLALLTGLHLMPEHGVLCVEEPEHGLHPLVFGVLLDLIRDRCPENGARQVLLTTHSPDLVDAAEPKEVVTVERARDGATILQPLEGTKLRKWLTDFRLGELWRMRQIGGVPQ